MSTYVAVIASITMLATTAFGKGWTAAPTGAAKTAVYVSAADNGSQATWAAQFGIDHETLTPMLTSTMPHATVVLTAGRGGGGMHGGGGSFHGGGGSFHRRGGSSHGGALHNEPFHGDFHGHNRFHGHHDFDHGHHGFHHDHDEFFFGFGFPFGGYYYPYYYPYYPYYPDNYYYPYWYCTPDGYCYYYGDTGDASPY